MTFILQILNLDFVAAGGIRVSKTHLFLCCLRSISAHRDHFVRGLSVRLCVCLSGSHTFLVFTHSYVSQVTHAFLQMLPLCYLSFYPHATGCGGDIGMLLFCPCMCMTLWVNMIDLTVLCLFIKLGKHVNFDERMNPIDFLGQRSRSQWSMVIYGNNMIKTEQYASSSYFSDILTMIRRGSQLISEVKVTNDTYL